MSGQQLAEKEAARGNLGFWWLHTKCPHCYLVSLLVWGTGHQITACASYMFRFILIAAIIPHSIFCSFVSFWDIYLVLSKGPGQINALCIWDFLSKANHCAAALLAKVHAGWAFSPTVCWHNTTEPGPHIEKQHLLPPNEQAVRAGSPVPFPTYCIPLSSTNAPSEVLKKTELWNQRETLPSSSASVHV